MAFDAYRQYQKDQRKQRRWEITLPTFIVAVLLLILAIAFHGAYVRSHAKPKPAAAEATFYDVQSSGFEPGHTIGKPGTVWIKCDAGMDVTNLADCPEYKHTKWASWSDWAKKNIYLAPCKEGDSKWWGDDDVAKCVKTSPKRKSTKIVGYTGHRAYDKCMSPFYDADTAVQPSFDALFAVCKSKLPESEQHGAYGTYGGGGWLVKDANIDNGHWHEEGPGRFLGNITDLRKPYAKTFLMMVGNKELDFRQYDEAGAFYTIDASPDAFDCPAAFEDTPDHMHSQLVIRCTPKREDFPDTSRGDGGNDYMPHFIPSTTPQDITNLMEQIAPTPKPIVEWHINPPAKPDCRMPADIDVCPQTVDPKGSHD